MVPIRYSLSSNILRAQRFGFRTAAAALSGSVTTRGSGRFLSTDLSNASRPVPVTLLAGFLGAGKTTTLKHLLENTEHVKIGVIVNDVASINIDAKLVSSEHTSPDSNMVQLENGCACCSIADELFSSVEKLLTGRDFDALVIELSGVGDPMAIKMNWKTAPQAVRRMASINNVVTVIDAHTFGSDYMTWDLAHNRKGWLPVGSQRTASGMQKVSELLAEQVEAADLILLNKMDLATEEQIGIAETMAKVLNDRAKLLRVEYGVVSPKQVLGMAIEDSAVEDQAHAHADDHHHHHHDHNHDHGVDRSHDHACNEPGCQESSHAHSHHDHSCDDPPCTDPSHSHGGHARDNAHACNEPDCEDSSHSHSHNHHSSDDPTCTDPSHGHDSHSASCSDPDCDDPSHSHSHNHATSTASLGIVSFVYKATRPFSTTRLMTLLNRWHVPKKDTLDLEYLTADTQQVDAFGQSTEGNPFVGLLRSKGFCWFAPQNWYDSWRHDTSMYLSHAGRHLSVKAAGRWWASFPPGELPKLFDEGNQAELERIRREDFVTEEFGDRRQEIVFIGMKHVMNESALREALEQCLLTDDEMDQYRKQLQEIPSETTTSATAANPGN